MQLHVARLCLDCNEIHDLQHCPVCGSHAFAYMSRWVPAPERRQHPRAASSPEADTYRELIEPRRSRRRSRLLKTGVVGVGLIAVAGWLLRGSNAPKSTEHVPGRDSL